MRDRCGSYEISDFLEYAERCSTEQSQNQLEDIDEKKKRSKREGHRRLSVVAMEDLPDESQWTTIILRNIPCRYTQECLLEEIDGTGQKYDFFYLPPARRRRGNLGYAFVNFVDAESAQRFIQLFEGHMFSQQPNAKKKAVIGWAKLQGFEQNRQFYSSARVTKTARHPYVKEGEEFASCGAKF
jgi:RNA recognition motif-containing protein